MLGFCLAGLLLLPHNDVKIIDDRTLIEGQWELDSLELDGRRIDPAQAPRTWTITAGIITIGREGLPPISDLRITLNEKTSPKQFSVEYVGKDPDLKVTYQQGIHGIYAIEKGKFIRCYVSADRPRPTEFVSTPGSMAFLHSLKRPEQPEPPK